MVKYRKKQVVFFMILSLFFYFALISCEKEGGNEDIPSYLHIDSITVVDNPLLEEGSLSTNITDAWVYVDEQLIGAFELPATIPILASGKHKVFILSGIKVNGISATRSFYPFYQPFEEEITLYRDSIITVNPITKYKDNTKFSVIEDFEDQGLAFEETSASDTILERNSETVFEGNWSGSVSLDSDKLKFEMATSEALFPYPRTGSYMFLELNYKVNNRVVIGHYVNSTSIVEKKPILILNQTEEWKKIYVNLTEAVNREINALNFEVFIGAMKEAGVDNPKIYLDNIKIVEFQ